jgi:hypothetical protein
VTQFDTSNNEPKVVHENILQGEVLKKISLNLPKTENIPPLKILKNNVFFTNIIKLISCEQINGFMDG